MAYERITTLEFIRQLTGGDPGQVTVQQAALIDTLLHAHQEEVARMEQQLREKALQVLGRGRPERRTA